MSARAPANQGAPTLAERLEGAASEGLETNVRRWARFFGFREGDAIELQALKVGSGRFPVNRFAHALDVDAAVRLAAEAERFDAMGVFVLANAVDPAVASRDIAGRWHDMQKGESTTDGDVRTRRVLFVDIDAKRPRGTSADAEQVRLTHDVAELIHSRLAAALGGDAALAVGHSGNGRAVLVALDDLAASPDVAALVRGVVAALAELYQTPRVEIDPAVVDAKRLLPCWGTTKRKGVAGDAKRPHRRTALVCAENVERLTQAQLERLFARIVEGLTAEQRTAVDRATGRKPAATPRVEAGAGSPGPALAKETQYTRANRVPPVLDVLDWLGLLEGDAPRCPGCGHGGEGDTSVAIVGNGLKCSHKSCAALGPVGRPGFRTLVDLVVEVRKVTPREAVELLAERFRFPGFSPEPPTVDPVGPEAAYEREERGALRDDAMASLPTKPTSRNGWPRVTAVDMREALPPIPWVVRELELAPGAPTMIAGYGYSGKTIAAQALALAVAGDLPVWGVWAARQGRVIHVDHEQGRRLTVERYQRMMRAANVELEPEELSLVVMPPTYLDAPGAEDVYCRELDGHVLAVIDSLRAAAPNADENDSEVRRSLDMLGRVSERTGCACVVIHHARKPSQGAMGGAKMEIRGSGALFDACQSVLVLGAEKGHPTRIEHEKARITGEAHPSRVLRVVDVERDGDPRWGLRVEVGDAAAETQADARGRLESLCSTVLEVVRGAPGSSGRAVIQLARATGWKGRPGDVGAALDILARDGAVRSRSGARRSTEWWAAGPGGSSPWGQDGT